MLRCSRCCLAFASIWLMAPQASAADRYANVHTVAIISALGDGIQLERKEDLTRNDIVPSVFFDTRAGLDEAVTKAVESAISSRFTVLHVPVDQAYLAKLSNSPATVVDVPERPVSQSAPPDAYIIVHPAITTTQTFIRALEYRHSGAALTRINKMFGGYGYTLGFQYRITVLDGRTGKRLSDGIAQLSKPSLWRQPLPYLGCDASLWPTDPSNVDAATVAQLRVELLAITARSLPVALESAHLVEDADKVPRSISPGGTSVCRILD